MIRNTWIDLSIDSKERKEAVNVIKYTLLLDYDVPYNVADDDAISSIMENCQKCCKGLFGVYGEMEIDYNFFGEIINEKKYRPIFKFSNEYNKETSLSRMILQHCILSSYHAILTHMLKDQKRTTYFLADKVMESDDKSHGYNSLSKGEHLSSPKDKLKISRKASDIKEKIEQRKRQMVSIEGLDIEITHGTKLVKEKEEDINYWELSLQFIPLWHRLCVADGRKFHLKNEAKEYLSKNNLLANINNLDEKILGKSEETDSADNIVDAFKTVSSGNKVDGVYMHYLTERLFNFNLLGNILQFIKYTNEKGLYKINNEFMIERLAQSSKLQNAFSRHFFLGYAIEMLLSEPSSYNDYWDRMNLANMDGAVRTLRNKDLGFHFTKWCEQLQLFIDYLAEYIIPIYEWCFLCMLLDYIEHNPRKDHPPIERAYDLLTKYIDNNAEKLLQPCLIDEGNELFSKDMVSSRYRHPYKEYKYTDCISDDVLAQLCEELIPIDLQYSTKVLSEFIWLLVSYIANQREQEIRKLIEDARDLKIELRLLADRTNITQKEIEKFLLHRGWGKDDREEYAQRLLQKESWSREDDKDYLEHVVDEKICDKGIKKDFIEKLLSNPKWTSQEENNILYEKKWEKIVEILKKHSFFHFNKKPKVEYSDSLMEVIDIILLAKEPIMDEDIRLFVRELKFKEKDFKAIESLLEKLISNKEIQNGKEVKRLLETYLWGLYDKELNIKPLTKELFKADITKFDGSTIKKQNRKNLSKFYTDLIRYTYLE